MRRSWFLLIGVLAAVCGCRTVPTGPPIPLSTENTSLAVAVSLSGEVRDPVARANVLVQIADGYIAAGMDTDASSVTSEAGRLVASIPPTPEAIELKLRIADRFLTTDDPASARRLISEAATYAQSERDENVRADLLVSVIRVAVHGEDDTRDMLPSIVDSIYIIEDTALRAETLIAVARAYQEMGVGQSVAGLIQQAIPAIRSVSDPLRRASLFAELSRRAAAAGDTSLSQALVEDAVDQFARGSDTASDPTVVTSLVIAVAADRGITAAVNLVARLDSPLSRATGFSTIASIKQAAGSAGRTLALAEEAAASIEDIPRRVAVLSDIALGYLDHGLDGAALRVADEAVAIVAQNLLVIADVRVLSDLAGVLAVLDRTDAARAFLGQFGVPYYRGVMAVAVADLLIDEGKQGVADDFLVDALLASDESDTRAEDLRADITRGFARSGNYSLAIRTIERMSDPALQAQAVASLGFFAESNGGLSTEQLEDLRDVLGL